jgi:hypothetical protein
MAVKTFNVGRAMTAEDFGFEKEAQELRTYLSAPAPARQAR